MTEEQVRALLTLSGVKYRNVYPTLNQYWKKDDVMGPWWLVITGHGVIRIGWRKRVIEIDWSDTGRAVEVTKDDVTKEPMLVHAWSYPKALEYLTALWHELERPPVSASDHK